VVPLGAEAPDSSHGDAERPSWQPDLLFAARGLAFYALDLRKSGRARRDGHTAHYVILALWLDHRRAAGRLAPVSALVLNSPWFDLQGKPSYAAR
jgi:alpha-beta hydrolase superfamily lysophospholipase